MCAMFFDVLLRTNFLSLFCDLGSRGESIESSWRSLSDALWRAVLELDFCAKTVPRAKCDARGTTELAAAMCNPIFAGGFCASTGRWPYFTHLRVDMCVFVL